MNQDHPPTEPTTPALAPEDVPQPVMTTPPRNVLLWWLPLAGLAFVVAAVPFYGYFVHGGRDDQWVFLVIGGAWLLTWLAALVFAIIGFVMPRPRKSARPASALGTLNFRLLSWLVAAALAATGVIAFGGVRTAFWELVP